LITRATTCVQTTARSRNGGEPPTPPQIQALRQINAEMAAVTADPLRRQELDLRWHQTLLESCPNERL
jgi:DNA-binding FadR family transcriptional regulator